MFQVVKILKRTHYSPDKFYLSVAHYSAVILGSSLIPRRIQKGQKIKDQKENLAKHKETIEKSNQRKNLSIEKKVNPNFYGSQKIEDYFTKEIIESWKGSLNPVMCGFRKRSTDSLFFCNEARADCVINAVKSSGESFCVPFIEINPGFGYLTERLLSLNIPFIKVFEKDPFFFKELSKLQLKNPERLKVFDNNFMDIFKVFYLDRLDDGSRFAKMMLGINPKKWTDEPSFKIIGALENMNFIKFINTNISMQFHLCEYGRPEMYLFMSPIIHAMLNREHVSYINYHSVLARIFYDIELLGSFDRRDFLPWIKNKRKLSKFLSSFDSSDIYLVKMVPRRNLFELIGGRENLKLLWYFAREFCKSGKKPLVPQIERYVPGCGYRLLRCNIHVFNLLEELSTDLILQAFLEFISWPEFKSSSFTCEIESFLLRYNVLSETTFESVEKDSATNTADANTEKP